MLASATIAAAGRTDGAIARDLLGACGIGDFEVDRVRAYTEARYAELVPEDLSGRLAPGVPEVLADLADEFRYSLLTGNFEGVARMKLARAGIGRYFPEGQGAFGSDAEDRNELVPVARERAGGWPRERTVVIGDTPRDVECARADGVRVIAIASGPYEAAELGAADPDALASRAADVVPVLRAWAGSGAA
jgi:phosphoglycolate phosphatase